MVKDNVPSIEKPSTVELKKLPSHLKYAYLESWHNFLKMWRLVEVFMADFFVFRESFQKNLDNLELVFKRCEESKLVLCLEKFHLMVKKGIFLGHCISKKGLEVDQAKIEVIEKKPPPSNIKGIKNFPWTCWFLHKVHQIFFKDYKTLCQLVHHDMSYLFIEECEQAFKTLKNALISASIVKTPD